MLEKKNMIIRIDEMGELWDLCESQRVSRIRNKQKEKTKKKYEEL